MWQFFQMVCCFNDCKEEFCLTIHLIASFLVNLTKFSRVRKISFYFYRPISSGSFFSQSIRYEETNELATSCKEGQKCIGGFGRMVTMIKHLKETLKDTNPIYLNAGDNFQGTLWYSIGRWNLTTQFMNMLDADAVVSSTNRIEAVFFWSGLVRLNAVC